AVFSKNTVVSVRKAASSAMNSVVEDRGGDTEAITLEQLAADHALDVIDLLKLDVEGGEQFLLTAENMNFFKRRVKNVFMEAHDLRGNKKENAGKYLRSVGFEVRETPFRWFFGIVRIQAWNAGLVTLQDRC
ncbi:MAG: hypothetical protein DMG14_19740, partial [Acidobacteria bacterium]